MVKAVLNRTQSTNSFACFYDKAGDKNFCTNFATAANAIYATSALLEILLILKRARSYSTIFMDDRQFYPDYLKSNSYEELRHGEQLLEINIPLNHFQSAMQTRGENCLGDTEQHSEQRQGQPEAIPEHVQAQKDFQSAINTLKENCLQGTEKPSDLKQPFQRPNPDEGDSHHLTMDKIHAAIHEDRAPHEFVKDLDRLKQLEEYPPDEEDCQFAKPEHIIDMQHKNVLVIGHPGVGKTLWSTTMLRLWASGEAFEVFNVVFLVKFWRFNDHGKLSFRELLGRAETVQRLDDSVWHVIKTESNKVLLIFDGLDKYSRKKDIKAQKDDSTYKNDLEEKMPFSVLYNKLVAGELFRGASIITTTRPIAVKYVAHVSFQRTVEIRGFTSKDVEDCVEKFTRGVPGAKEKIGRAHV